MTNQFPLLECRDLTAGYAEPVVGPASFVLHAGEVVGLHGKNGSGKSTLLGAITGATRIFSGEVRRSAGLRVAHHRQRPERSGQLPLTGFELLRLTGAPPDQVTGFLRELLSVRLDRLSGGQFQLIQTWACLGSPAQLVLLDEPTNNLDAAAMDALSEMLRREAERRAVLLVSHEGEFLEAACHRVIRLPV
jgi:ABC-2 type transport system ATP-binding protein